jgi:hypothetical protein
VILTHLLNIRLFKSKKSFIWLNTQVALNGLLTAMSRGCSFFVNPRHARYLYKKKEECRKDRSARNTIGAHYLPKNTVLIQTSHLVTNMWLWQLVSEVRAWQHVTNLCYMSITFMAVVGGFKLDSNVIYTRIANIVTILGLLKCWISTCAPIAVHILNRI